MAKSVKISIVIVVSILLLSIASVILGTIWANQHPLAAEIYQNGVLLYTINLNDVTETYEIVITGDNASNTILVEPGVISMADASCPDHICVRTGKINSPLMPITCLPNKVVIKITGNTDNEIDMITY